MYLALGVLITRRPLILATGVALGIATRACAADEESALITRDTRCLRYYGPIESKSLLTLNSILCDMSEESDDPIHLHIQSPGGELIPALYTSDLIESLSPQVHTYVDGLCASAATLLTVAGNVRHMSKNSIFMIHQLSSVQAGTYNELTQALKNSDVLMDKLTNIYTKRSNLDLPELKQLLAIDKYLDSDTCLQYGLIDIID